MTTTSGDGRMKADPPVRELQLARAAVLVRALAHLADHQAPAGCGLCRSVERYVEANAAWEAREAAAGRPTV